MRAGIVALALVLTPAVGAAQELAEFCSDRPGLATGTCTAAAGRFQLESSSAEWSSSRSSGTREDEIAFAASTLRYGISDRTDLHLSWTPYIHRRERSPEGVDRHQGAGDVEIGLKHRLTGGGGAVDVALMPFLKLPAARRPIGNRRVEVGMLLPIDASLGGPWSLTLTPEIDWNADGDGDGHHARLAGAASLGFELSSRWSLALDGMVARERDQGETVHDAIMGLSLALMVTPTLQLDVEADVGLSREAPDLQLLSGVAFRF